MDDINIIAALPNVAHPRAMEMARSVYPGGDYILYSRESIITYEAPMQDLMSPEAMEAREKSAKRRWGARCSCTACGEEFITGWHDGCMLIAMGDDGNMYDGWVDKASAEEGFTVIDVAEPDGMICPICGTGCDVIKRSRLRNGRIFNQLVATFEILPGNLLALVTWLVSRHLGAEGESYKEAVPRDAAVLMPGGSLRYYSRSRSGQFISAEHYESWRRIKQGTDPTQRFYYSYESTNGKTFGCDIEKPPFSFAGTTAEKTGLEDYIRLGGAWPVLYLKYWKNHKNIENLVKSEFGYLIEAEIRKEMESAMSYHSVMYHTLPKTKLDDCFSFADFRKVKPHEMLGMSKAEFRAAAEYPWDPEALWSWQNYNARCERMSPENFILDIIALGESNVYELADNYICGEDCLLLSDFHKYAEKQTMQEADQVARLLIDYRKMLYELYDGKKHQYTYEELWPREIMAAHDRLSAALSNAKDKKFDANFKNIKKKYNALEWTDGELCIIIPESNAELIREGEILRHCVGSYGDSHISGKPIFFVRHYRRPERPYYTLNENLTGKKPSRIQLHGYGNEHHGAHKEHSHGIPRKVTDFVDRWEREVLAPWFVRYRAEEIKKKKEIKAA